MQNEKGLGVKLVEFDNIHTKNESIQIQQQLSDDDRLFIQNYSTKFNEEYTNAINLKKELSQFLFFDPEMYQINNFLEENEMNWLIDYINEKSENFAEDQEGLSFFQMNDDSSIIEGIKTKIAELSGLLTFFHMYLYNQIYRCGDSHASTDSGLYLISSIFSDPLTRFCALKWDKKFICIMIQVKSLISTP